MLPTPASITVNHVKRWDKYHEYAVANNNKLEQQTDSTYYLTEEWDSSVNLLIPIVVVKQVH